MTMSGSLAITLLAVHLPIAYDAALQEGRYEMQPLFNLKLCRAILTSRISFCEANAV